MKFVIQKENCFKCGRKINKNKDNYVSLTTFNLGDLIEEVNFHCKCWGEYNQQRVNDRLSEMDNVGLGLLKNSGMVN